MKLYCPVDEKETNIKSDGTCEQCDSDLTPLLRLKELPKGYFQEALRLKETGHINDAIEKLIMVINVVGDHADAFFELGELYSDKGMLDEAIARYDKAMSIEPGNEKIRQATEKAKELLANSLRTKHEESHRIVLFRKIAIVATFVAFLSGVAVMPIFKKYLSAEPTRIAQVNESSKVDISNKNEIATFKYIVKPSDNLELVAYRFYGSRQMWRKIYEKNKNGIADPNNLSVGQAILVPISIERSPN